MKKTMRINKTESNLQKVWEQLDEASGSLYNALDNIASMTDIPNEIKSNMERIDITLINSLRNEIEELIQQKKK